jgi:hypothetical protein
MLRGSTDPGAPFYAALVTPGNGFFVEYRTAPNAWFVAGTPVSGTVPRYLKVSRTGSTFSAYSSGDGSAWTLIPGSTTTLNLPATLLAGLAVTAHANGVLNTVTVAHVVRSLATASPTASATHMPVPPTPTSTNTVVPTATHTPLPPSPTMTNTATPTATHTPLPPSPTATNTATPTASATTTPVPPTSTATSAPAQADPCPSGWSCADIGSPALTGSDTMTNGTWTIQSSGGDIWGSADQFHFDWQILSGDGSVSAQVLTQTNTSAWAKAGVMLRGSTDPGAPFYAALVTPGNGFFIEYRTAPNAWFVAGTPVSGTVPRYLKVSRTGTTFSAYSSTDGSAWTLIPGSTTTLNLPATLLGGLAVTAHANGVLNTVTVAHIAL